MIAVGGLAARIAGRYLWKKKSHGAVSAIAVVAVTGVAVATAAILCVMSVFNGFRDMLQQSASRILPDVEVTARYGKTIASGDSLCAVIGAVKGVEVAMPVVEDQALAIFGVREMPVALRGVDPSLFSKITQMDSIMMAGRNIGPDAMDSEPPAGLISVGVGSRLQVYSPGEDRLFIFAPRREGMINPNNPMSSFFTDSIAVSGVFRSDRTETDAATVIVPIDVARGLFQYEDEATAIDVKGSAGIDPAELASAIATRINGDKEGNFVVKDRQRLEEVSWRMVEIEKWITTLLLFFILIIASFNIISTMTMFVLEKRRSLGILRALGMTRRRIGMIFGWESMYITLLGGGIGIAAGVGLTLLQQYYPLIMIDPSSADPIAYPVRLALIDIPVVAAAVIVTGIVTALISGGYASRNISGKRR